MDRERRCDWVQYEQTCLCRGKLIGQPESSSAPSQGSLPGQLTVLLVSLIYHLRSIPIDSLT